MTETNGGNEKNLLRSSINRNRSIDSSRRNEGIQNRQKSNKTSERREPTAGILRVKPRRNSAESMDFCEMPNRLATQGHPSSPQPSVDRLSVTFADKSYSSESKIKINFDSSSSQFPVQDMEKIRFPSSPPDENNEEEKDDDYSASVSVIMQRRESMKRGSSRKKRRRTSSPLPDLNGSLHESRRRSSEYTNSSGETHISIDNETTQEQIFENIRLHKEVLSSVKLQPWKMRKKIKLVQQAKAYVKRHEGELQERLAMSKSTKDILARFNIWLINELNFLKREMANTMTLLIPWELRIKEIESHFGSAVASYFTFLRWMFWVNLVITIVLACFVAIPEILIADVKAAGERKEMLPDEKKTAYNLVTLWDFGGVLKYSPIFYGYYTNDDGTGAGYRLPFAYFLTGLAVYVYSFVATLRRMAENSRMSKLSEKDDECVFTWKIFTGWDYMIGNAETAHNRVASLILGFKEVLLEETQRKKDEKNWKVICLRVFVTFIVMGLFAFSAYIVFVVVERSTQPEANDSWWRQNEITVSVSIISLLFPLCFELLGLLEGYHPRKSLRIQLARIMVLNLLNLYTLIFSQFWKISDMTVELQSLKQNYSLDHLQGISTGPEPSNSKCVTIAINCTKPFLESETTPLLLTTSSPFVRQQQTLNSNVDSDLIGTLYYFENLTTPMDVAKSDVYNNSTEFFTSPISYSTPLEPNLTESANFSDLGLNDSFSYSTSPSTLNYSQIDEYTEFTNSSEFSSTTQSTYKSDESREEKNFFFSTVPDELSNSTETSRYEGTLEWQSNESTTKWDQVNATSQVYFDSKNIIIPKDNIENQKALQPTVCFVQKCEDKSVIGRNEKSIHSLYDLEMRKRLRSLCWETMFGQELVKLTVMDLILTILSVLLLDFFRAIFVRVMNNCWCWDLEKKFPQYGDFKIAENILHLVYNQGMVWMGMFFSPGLPAINLVKLAIMMYLRSWAVLTCNVPHEVVFRASRSNNFYLALLLTMLFLCVLPVGYAIVWIEPSWHCGPFSDYKRIYHLFTKTLQKALPKTLHKALDYIASPGIIIPLLMLLILIIYYLISLTNSLREANNDLKIQLRRERTEERRKMFQMVSKRVGKGGKDAETPFAKWKKLLPELAARQAAQSSDVEKGEKNEEKGGMMATTTTTEEEKRKVNLKELITQSLRDGHMKSTAFEPKTETLEKINLQEGEKNSRFQELVSKMNLRSPKESKTVGGTTNISDVHKTNKNMWITEFGENTKDEKNSDVDDSGVQENALQFAENIPIIKISEIESDEQSTKEDVTGEN